MTSYCKGMLNVALIYLACISLDKSCEGFIFELAKIIPDFRLRPVMLHVGNQMVEPTTVNIIKAHGYPVETHQVISTDGYIQEVHRIPSQSSFSLPVILQHGNFQSSVDWVINSPFNSSLAFMLADNGYDVWLGNQRGNTYSTGHVEYSIFSSKYWDFSFHEVGKYDVPALVDYVLDITGKPKVHYLSFSMGTTAFYAGLSLRPELSDKIGLGITMGPSVFQRNFINGWPRLIAFSAKWGTEFEKQFGYFPVLPHFLGSMLNAFLPRFCKPKFDIFGICQSFLRVAMGDDGGLITKEQIQTISSVAPSPTAFKSFNHIVQLIGSGGFNQYDYGKRRNLEVYGRPSPLEYNLTNVQAPIVIMVGAYDFLAHRDDAKHLASRLPNVLQYYTAPYKQFTHLDFTYGRQEAMKVYLHIINLLTEFDSVFYQFFGSTG